MSGIRLTDGQPGPATQSALGLVTQATDAEVALGLNTGKYVTPAALKNAGATALGLGTAAFKNFADAFFNASDLQGRDIATTVPTDGQALVWNLANSRWQPGTVSTTVGTVTSVDASGGTTGLSFSGGPVTTSGTLTLAGTLAVANGGTGATDASGARSNLGLAIGTEVQAYDAGLASIAGLTTSADQGIYTTAADTYATFSLTSAGRALLDDVDAAAQRTTLGLGSAALLTAAAPSGAATLDGSGKLVSSQIPDISVTEYLGSVASEAAMLALSGQKGDWAIRSDLGTTWIITGNDPTVLASWTQLSYPAAPVTSVFGRTGAIAAVSSDYSSVGLTGTAIGASSPSSGAFTTLSCPSISFTGGSITGITDLAVADGGTGAGTAADARVNLLPSYTGNGSKVLALNSGATDTEWITAGAGTVTSVDVSGGTTGLTTSGGPVTASGTITLAGTLAVANGGTGASTLTGYVKGAGTGALTASATVPNTDITGLGTMSTQASSSVSITGGSITGITDLAVADGGTGASTAADARLNLLPAVATNAGKVLTVNSGSTDMEWASPAPAVATVATTAPGSPVNGQLWWNSETGNLQIYYNDVNSAQWVNVFNRL